MARIAIVIDLALLWILWPRIARGDTVGIGWSGFRRSKVLASLLASALTVLLVVTIATFPGEWLEEKLPPVRFIPTSWKAWTLPSGQAIQSVGSGWVTLHGLLVAGEVNYVTGRPRSLWSNVLVLPNFEIDDRVRFEADGKSSISSKPLSLRGCSLQGAVLPFADLRRADFTGASLSDAKLFGADLREAKFECDWIGGLPGFHPFGEVENKDRICTQLNGALLVNAQLQGASLDRAQLHNAFLANAQLQGANLDNAGLQGDQLWFAHLQGASLKIHSCKAPLLSTRSCAVPSYIKRNSRAPYSIVHSCRAPCSSQPNSRALGSLRRSCKAPLFAVPLFGEAIPDQQTRRTRSLTHPSSGRSISD